MHKPTAPPPPFALARLPIAHCAACAADVLVARDLDGDDRWILCCARCGTPVAPDAELREAGADDLEALGFTPGRLPGEGGCGNGQCGR